jgi:hypothetical protein
VWLFEDAGTSWRDMTSGSMYWSLQASTVCREIVKPAIVFRDTALEVLTSGFVFRDRGNTTGNQIVPTMLHYQSDHSFPRSLD